MRGVEGPKIVYQENPDVYIYLCNQTFINISDLFKYIIVVYGISVISCEIYIIIVCGIDENRFLIYDRCRQISINRW